MKGSDNPFPSILVADTVDPTPPSSGYHRLFVDTDEKLKMIDHASLVTDFTPAAAVYSGCKAYNSGTQAFNATTLTYMILNAEDFDTDTYHDNSTNNSRLTAPFTGYYRVEGLIWYATTSGSNYILIDKGHAAAYIRGGGGMYSGVGSAAFISTVIHLTASEYLEMVGYHTQSGSITTGDAGTTPSQQNWFAMQYLGA